MIRLALLLVPCLWPAASIATSAPGEAVGVNLDYTVAIPSAKGEVVDVTARITNLPAAMRTVRLSLPTGYTFVRLPEPLLEGAVEVAGDRTDVAVERVGPYDWNVLTAGATEVEVRYRVPLRHRRLESVADRDAYEFPYLAADHGMLTAWTLFMAPPDLQPARIRVAMRLPEGWEAIAPWPSPQPGRYAPADVASLQGDLIAVGGWHTHEIRSGDFVATVAFAPGQDELERAATEPIRRIVEAELALFGEPPSGSYLFLFGRPDMPGAGGSPKRQSMTLTVEPALGALGVGHQAHLVAHEFYHTWAAAHFDAPDELRWVNEGFTDYYAYLVSARLGLISWDRFAERLAEAMQACAANGKAGKLSLIDAGGEVFFKDQDAYHLVYEGGMLLAAWLDRSIRANGKGHTLDDFMRALINDRRWAPGRSAPQVSDLLAKLAGFVGPQTVADLERFAREPYRFDPVVSFPALGVTVSRKQAPPRFDLRANLDGTKVRDMDHKGLAGMVGILPGDRFVEINGQAVASPGDVHRAWRNPQEDRIQATILRDGQRITIDEPVPVVETYHVPAEPWRQHALP